MNKIHRKEDIPLVFIFYLIKKTGYYLIRVELPNLARLYILYIFWCFLRASETIYGSRILISQLDFMDNVTNLRTCVLQRTFAMMSNKL